MYKYPEFQVSSRKKFHSCYRLKECESNEELTDVEEIHFIEIPKLPKDADITDLLVAWVQFLKDPESQEVRNLELSLEEIREAKDELIRISNDDKQRALYEAREKANKDRTSALAESKREGKLEGKKETAISIAKGLLDVLNEEMIAEKTELTLEEVNSLKKYEQ